MKVIQQIRRYRRTDSDRYLQEYVESEQFATETQLKKIDELDGNIVIHGVIARHGDESIQQWALIDAPDPENHRRRIALWVKPDGTTEEAHTPYPWCRGNPNRATCVAHGSCRRNPNCGE